MHFGRALIGALAGGILGGVVWVIIGYMGFEVGYVAWGIGFLAGLGVRFALGDEDGAIYGVIAAAVAVVCVLAAKYMVIEIMMGPELEAIAGAEDIDVEAVKMEVFKESFGLFDMLWFFLAAATAYKLGSGGDADEGDTSANLDPVR